MSQKIIETNELTKKYKNFTALNKVSMTLEQGDIYGLIGRNGAGKTTLFKLIMGLSQPTSGGLIIGETKESINSLRNLSHERKNIGFMIGLSFFPYLSAFENIEYYRNLKGIPDKQETLRVLKLVGLDGVKKPFRSFSTGMKQRLGIANALLNSPPIVILDEPINGLDPQGIADIRNMIKDMHKTGITFIVSSHVLSELDLVATKFGFIEQGVLLKEIGFNDLHKQTRRSLIIETDNPEKAVNILKEKTSDIINANSYLIENNKIIINGCLDISNQIARVLIENGVELFELKRQETTLEEYFINLIGGKINA
ncbi:MAG: ATP-binding cassette domain-containing protein [Oscillospiraceae bacterium]|nr:ATP-binding cassette domain-containing protein [Oscillospiraceae bacterium]